MSTALYRRYRPETFDEVIGQEHVTEPLKAAIERGRINHAYLFSGPRGCGKTTSARILARCLNCEKGPTPVPCGQCPSCMDLANGGPGSLDVVEIDAASHNGVDDARDLRERAIYAPARDRYKVFILDEAHMVTSQGFNALLKIVEEPPPHIKFIFATTEPEKVIGTIRSRTHHYPFRLVPPEALGNYLDELCGREGVQVAKGVLPLVVRAGGGSVRDTLSVLDQLIAGSGPDGVDYGRAIALLGYTPDSLLSDIVDAFSAGDGAGVYRAVERVIESGQDPRRFVEDLLERFRDLIVINAAPEAAHAFLPEVPPDRLERLTLQANGFGQGELSRAADLLNVGLTEMSGATSPRLQLELICARILLPGSGRSRDAVLSRVERMERRIGMSATGVAANVPAAPAAGQAPAAGPASGAGEASQAPAAAGDQAAEQAGRANAASQQANLGQQANSGQQAGHDDFDDIAAMAVAAESMLNAPVEPSHSATPTPPTAQSEPPVPSRPAEPAKTDAAEAAPSASTSAPEQNSQHPGNQPPGPNSQQAEPDVGQAEPAVGQAEPDAQDQSSRVASQRNDPQANAPQHGAPAQKRNEPQHGAPAEKRNEPQQNAPTQMQNESQANAPQQNTPVPAREQQSPEAAREQAAPEATSVTGSGDIGGEIEAIRRAWPSILAAVEKRSRLTRAIIAANAIPQSFSEGTVYLGFNNAGSVQGFQQRDHAAKLAAAINDVLGIQARIDIGEVGRIGGSASGGNHQGKGSSAPSMTDGGGNHGPAPSQRRPSPQEVAAVVGTREVDKPQVDHEKFWEPSGPTQGPWSSDDEEGDQPGPPSEPTSENHNPAPGHVTQTTPAPPVTTGSSGDDEPTSTGDFAEPETTDATETVVEPQATADPAAGEPASAGEAPAGGPEPASDWSTGQPEAAGEPESSAEPNAADDSDDALDGPETANDSNDGPGATGLSSDEPEPAAEPEPAPEPEPATEPGTATEPEPSADEPGVSSDVPEIVVPDLSDDDFFGTSTDQSPDPVADEGSSSAPMEYVEPRWDEPNWHDGPADTDFTSAGSGAVDVGAVVVPPPDDDLDYPDFTADPNDFASGTAAPDTQSAPSVPTPPAARGNEAKPFKSRFAALAEKHGVTTTAPTGSGFGSGATADGGGNGWPGAASAGANPYPQNSGSDEDEYDPETDLDVSDAPQIGVDVIARVLGGEIIDEREI